MNASVVRRQVIAYLSLAFGASIAVAFLLPSSPVAPVVSGGLPVAVLVVLSVVWGWRAIWTGLGVRRAGLTYWPVAIAVPAGVAALVYAAAVAWGVVDRGHGLFASLGWGLLLNLALTGVFVLGEEVGWRGFLLPRISRLTGPRRGAVLTGFLHALVHLPVVIFTTTYNSAGSRWLIVPTTVVTITAAGVLYAWLRDASGSIWPATLAHATGNTLVGMITATAAPGSETTMAYLAGEGGLITSLGMSAVAVVILVRARIWRPIGALDRPPVNSIGGAS